MISKLVNNKGELIGIRRQENYNGQLLSVEVYAHCCMDKVTRRYAIKRCIEEMNRRKNELDEKARKERHKKSMMKLFDKVGRHEEYLTVEEMRKACMLNHDLAYAYDLLGYLTDFETTKKGLKAIDSLGNKVYFYPKDKYVFYKSCFRGML